MKVEKVIHEVRRAVVATRNTHRLLAKLRTLGFEILAGGRSGHHHVRHPLLGRHKLTLGSSPSDVRWPLNFVREFRHAVWKNQKNELCV